MQGGAAPSTVAFLRASLRCWWRLMEMELMMIQHGRRSAVDGHPLPRRGWRNLDPPTYWLRDNHRDLGRWGHRREAREGVKAAGMDADVEHQHAAGPTVCVDRRYPLLTDTPHPHPLPPPRTNPEPDPQMPA